MRRNLYIERGIERDSCQRFNLINDRERREDIYKKESSQHERISHKKDFKYLAEKKTQEAALKSSNKVSSSVGLSIPRLGLTPRPPRIYSATPVV